MIKFHDGTEITWEEAARMIEAEGRIGTGVWVDATGLRCTSAVIRNITGPRGTNSNLRTFDPPEGSAEYQISIANDGFVGTPKERAVYMAEWLRAQDKETLEVT